MEHIIKRMPQGWFPSVDCGDGWKNIINELDELLSFIDPEYEVHQVKEKYGTLRYYFASKFPFDSVQHRIMDSLVDRAEHLSAVTCEDCGKAQYGKISNIDETVKIRTNGWWKTLCDTCAIKRGYPTEVDDETSLL
jgi:hypothetical protein